MAARTVSNDEKAAVWEAYRRGQPVRVPVQLGTNPRIVVLNPQLNPGFSFEQAAQDPEAHVEVVLRYQHYLHTVLNHCTDAPTGLPDVWPVNLYTYNVYEAALLGAKVVYTSNSVPATEPWLDEANKEAVFDLPINRPLELPFIRDRLAFWHEMKRVCAGRTFEGRPVQLMPWALTGTDGPVTVACNLRGDAFLEDLIADPEYADRLLTFVTRAAIERRRAFQQYWGEQIGRGNGMADDACLMVSPRMYEQRVLPHHRRFYEAVDHRLPRSMHLCGDAGHLLPMIHVQLGVNSFDTGFPIDHGALREQLGPDVELLGGPRIALLLSGSTEQVYRETKRILHSGVTEGGRFVLREGNNLPPCCPLENLEAMYAACLEHGWYDHASGAPRLVSAKEHVAR